MRFTRSALPAALHFPMETTSILRKPVQELILFEANVYSWYVCPCEGSFVLVDFKVKTKRCFTWANGATINMLQITSGLKHLC